MNLLRFTELMSQSFQPDKQKIKQQILQKKAKPRWAKVTAICTAAVLVIGIVAACGYTYFMSTPSSDVWTLPESLKGISKISSVTPTKYDGNFIKTDCGFEVTTAKAITVDEFCEAFEITPKTEFEVTKKSGNSFNINFTSALKQNTLYTLASKLGQKTVYSWAYQTESEFEVISATNGILTDEQIWVEFSQPDVENFEQFFTITPAIAGTFEKYLNKWLFIPSSDFKSGTVYTVTIDKNIMGAASKTLKQDYVFSFCYQNQNWLEVEYKTTDVKCDTFYPEQIPSVNLFATDGISTKKAQVKTYSISSANEFISLYKNNVINGLISSAITKNLKDKLFEFVATPTKNSDNTLTFKYPKKLEKGYYVSVIEIDKNVAYHIFQVNDVYAFSVNGANGTGAFLYDTKTNMPLKDVKINKDQKTDSSGYALLTNNYNTINTTTPYVFITDDGNDYSAYHSMLLTNGENFSINNTVKVWGFTQSKAADNIAPEYAELICDWNKRSIPLTLDTTGKFECEFVIDNTANQEFGVIDLVVDNKVLQSNRIKINSKNEPYYNVSVTTNSNCYFEKDTVEYTIYAALNDGTPLENIVVSYEQDGKITELKTNSRGLVTFTETAKVNDGSPAVVEKEFSFTQIDNEQQTIKTSYTVFASNTFIDDVEFTKNTISLKTYKVNKQAFDFKGESTDASVTQKIYRLKYKKGENDSIYTTDTELVKQNELETKGGSLSISYSLPQDEYEYFMVFECGKNEYKLEFCNSSEYVSDFKYNFGGSDYYEINADNPLSLVKDKQSLVKKGTALVIGVSQDDIVFYDVFYANDINPNYNKDCLQGTTLYGAYFDGKEFWQIEPKQLFCLDNNLNITLETSKDEYIPGEIVYTSISVVGRDKKPVECQLNLNVVSNGKSEYFKSIATDSAGKVKIDFELSDVLGNRQIQVTCFDKSAKTGFVTKDIAVGRDVNVETFILDKTDIKDDIAFAFRITGKKAVKAFDYTAVLFNDGIQIASKKGSAKPNQLKTENFGKADKTGKYSINVYVKNTDISAEADCEFLIKDGTDIDVITTKTNVVNSKLDLSNFTSNIKVNLYDENNEFYTTVISKMSDMYKARIDHAIAKLTAYDSANTQELLQFITKDGIDKFKNDAHLSVMQTAAVSAVANKLFNAALLDEYFENAVSKTPDVSAQIAYLLFGASQKRPVLYSLNAIKSNIDSLTDEQAIMVALAYAYAGDFDSAYEIYNKKIEFKIKSANGIAYMPCETPHMSEYMTVIATVLTSKLSIDRAKELVKWLFLCDDETLTGIAYTEFANSFISKLNGTNTVIFEDSKSVISDLVFEKSDSEAVSILQSGLHEVRFANKKGKSIMTVIGKTPLESTIKGYKKLKDTAITLNASKAVLNDGDKFTLTLSIEKGANTRSLISLPHTIKLLSKNIVTGTGHINSNQSLTELEVYCHSDSMTVEFECYASVEGEFCISPVVALDDINKKYAKSEQLKLTVK